jgi:hypothetical protein
MRKPDTYFFLSLILFIIMNSGPLAPKSNMLDLFGIVKRFGTGSLLLP